MPEIVTSARVTTGANHSFIAIGHSDPRIVLIAVIVSKASNVFGAQIVTMHSTVSHAHSHTTAQIAITSTIAADARIVLGA